MFLQSHLLEIIEKLKLNCECEEEIMKLITIDFNNSVLSINDYYKSIINLCIDLYWNKPSYIVTPIYKNIDWD